MLKGQADLEDLDSIEGQFRIETALDVGRFAKTMLLARKQKIADQIASAAERLDHDFGSARWHDFVLIALKEYDRFRESIGVMERRKFAASWQG